MKNSFLLCHFILLFFQSFFHISTWFQKKCVQKEDSPVILRLFCGCPHISQNIHARRSMGEYPPNVRWSLHLVNLKNQLCSFHVQSSGAWRYSFAIRCSFLLKNEIASIIDQNGFFVNQMPFLHEILKFLLCISKGFCAKIRSCIVTQKRRRTR